MSNHRILVASGHPILRGAVTRVLERRGHVASCVNTFEEALANLTGGGFDLLMVHLEDRPADSEKLVAEVRKAQPTLPVLFLRPAQAGTICWPRNPGPANTARIDLPFEPEMLCVRVEELILQSTLRAPGAE